jgi:serine/threonine-protein kinase
MNPQGCSWKTGIAAWPAFILHPFFRDARHAVRYRRPAPGATFTFAQHDTFLVGRSRHAHFQLPAKDKFFSRVHFMLEVNPPQCRLIDMGSHNGTYVNGQRVLMADLRDGDQIRAGHTVLAVRVLADETNEPAPAAPAPVPAGGLPFIPGYVALRELGPSRLGAAYEAKRLGDERSVTVRLLRPEHEPTRTQTEDFLRAGRFLLKLAHPHLARLHDLGTVHGQFYFAYEHVPGPSVQELVEREGPLPVPRALHWIRQVLDALDYAHGQHFVHGDIRPGNLLLETGDTTKLADFGIARLYQSAPFSGLSITNDLRAAAFLPPELLLDYRTVQPAADQYAVAATLYYLLTGQQVIELPVEVHKRLSTLLRHQPVPIRTRRPDVSTALAGALERALARSPAQRFPSVAAFRAALLDQ